jgi:hypothetical protein
MTLLKICQLLGAVVIVVVVYGLILWLHQE